MMIAMHMQSIIIYCIIHYSTIVLISLLIIYYVHELSIIVIIVY